MLLYRRGNVIGTGKNPNCPFGHDHCFSLSGTVSKTSYPWDSSNDKTFAFRGSLSGLAKKMLCARPLSWKRTSRMLCLIL